MTSMREYWAREAEMMRDKSAVLGDNSLSNTPYRNEQNTIKATITFAPEFEVGVGAELQKLTNLTPLYKDYLTESAKQSVYDTYIFSFPSMITYDTGLASVVNFDDKGYAKGIGTQGRTFLVGNEQEFKQSKSFNSDPQNAYVLQFVSVGALKLSFAQGKKIVLIGVARQFLSPSDYPINGDFYTKLEKDTKSEAYYEWWDNAKLSGTHVIIHELIAHGINYLKNIKKTPEEEHFDYHGTKGVSSPNIADVMAASKKYKDTIMYKAITQIQLAIKTRYHGKK